MQNIKTNKANVLSLVDYFIPGYLGGGPITTLVNMRKQLREQIKLSIFTRDRDLGCEFQYPNIQMNQWIDDPDGPIYYACPESFGPKGLLDVLSAGKFDLVYLNSFFSMHASILPLIALRKSHSSLPVLLAPRGEFSPGALSIKRYKKSLFLIFARFMALYNQVFWHASTHLEAADIKRIFPSARGRIFVAADPVVAESPDKEYPAPRFDSNRLRIAFISRISPKKNLDGLLRILNTVSAEVQVDIFGPIEDNAYWKLCEDLINRLPKNILVDVRGSIAQHLVTDTFAQYDVFAFPTHGENFGHVIFESLNAGTPVIVSDQTPWKEDAGGALSVIALADTSGWREAIEKAASSSLVERKQARCAARTYAIRYAANAKTQMENLELFTRVLSY